MKRFAQILSIIFVILTFVGAGYIWYHHGTVSAGYAVVPMLFALVSILFYRQKK